MTHFMPSWRPVAAIALLDREGRLLLQRRPQHKHHGGLWELPGGKVEDAETPREALARELREELGIVIDPAMLDPYMLDDEVAEGLTVLLVYRMEWEGGTIEPMENQEWGWFHPDAATSLDLAPMDRTLVHKLLN